MQSGQQLGQARSGRRRHPLYPPRQLPPHPQLQTRRRVRWLPVVLIATAVIVAAVVALGPHGQRTPYVNRPYAPQPQRSAEVVGNPDGPLSQ